MRTSRMGDADGRSCRSKGVHGRIRSMPGGTVAVLRCCTSLGATYPRSQFGNRYWDAQQKVLLSTRNAHGAQPLRCQPWTRTHGCSSSSPAVCQEPSSAPCSHRASARPSSPWPERGRGGLSTSRLTAPSCTPTACRWTKSSSGLLSPPTGPSWTRCRHPLSATPGSRRRRTPREAEADRLGGELLITYQSALRSAPRAPTRRPCSVAECPCWGVMQFSARRPVVAVVGKGARRAAGHQASQARRRMPRECPRLSVSVGCIWHGCGTDNAPTAPEAVGGQLHELPQHAFGNSCGPRVDHEANVRAV